MNKPNLPDPYEDFVLFHLQNATFKNRINKPQGLPNQVQVEFWTYIRPGTGKARWEQWSSPRGYDAGEGAAVRECFSRAVDALAYTVEVLEGRQPAPRAMGKILKEYFRDTRALTRSDTIQTTLRKLLNALYACDTINPLYVGSLPNAAGEGYNEPSPTARRSSEVRRIQQAPDSIDRRLQRVFSRVRTEKRLIAHMTQLLQNRTRTNAVTKTVPAPHMTPMYNYGQVWDVDGARLLLHELLHKYCDCSDFFYYKTTEKSYYQKMPLEMAIDNADSFALFVVAVKAGRVRPASRRPTR